jgi:hypothetical protein
MIKNIILFLLPSMALAQTFNTDVLRFNSNGTVTAPALIWRGAPTTGIYAPSSTEIGFSISGTQRLAISQDAVLFRDGSQSLPGMSFIEYANTGFYRAGSTTALNRIGLSINGEDAFVARPARLEVISTVSHGAENVVEISRSLNSVTTNGMNVRGNLNPAQINEFRGINVTHFVSNTAGTINDMYYVNVSGTIGGATPTVTNQNGFRVIFNDTHATNAFGFRGQVQSGTNRWNLYMDGTAQNYLLGNLGIGSGKTAPAQALDVNGSGAFSTSVLTPVVRATGSGGVQLRSEDNTLVATAGASNSDGMVVEGALQTNTSLVIEDPGAGTNKITLNAPTLADDYTLTLPAAQGSVGQTLVNNGSGALSWESAGGGGGLPVINNFTVDNITATSDARQLWRFTGTSSLFLLTIDNTDVVDGAELEIMVVSTSYILAMNQNDSDAGWLLNGEWVGRRGSKIVLRWDDGLDRWVEVTRNGI